MQTDEAAEPTTEEPTAEAESDAPPAEESALAAAVDQQAAESTGTAAEQEPEVPDDASAKIAAAQEHIESLNMDEERAAAKRAM